MTTVETLLARSLGLEVVLLELAIERSLADSQQPRRQEFVSVELSDGVENRLPLQLRDGDDFCGTIRVDDSVAVSSMDGAG